MGQGSRESQGRAGGFYSVNADSVLALVSGLSTFQISLRKPQPATTRLGSVDS